MVVPVLLLPHYWISSFVWELAVFFFLNVLWSEHCGEHVPASSLLI